MRRSFEIESQSWSLNTQHNMYSLVYPVESYDEKQSFEMFEVSKDDFEPLNLKSNEQIVSMFTVHCLSPWIIQSIVSTQASQAD